MLDLFLVFSKTGLVLFKAAFTALKGDPVDALVRTVLLENRETTAEHSLMASMLSSISSSTSMTLFLSPCTQACSPPLTEEFRPKFDKLLWEAEQGAGRARRSPKANNTTGSNSLAAGEPHEDEASDEDAVNDLMQRQLSRRERAAKGPRAFQGKKKKGATAVDDEEAKKKKKHPAKEARTWDGQSKMTEEEAQALDMSENKASDQDIDRANRERAQKYMPDCFGEKADIDKSDEDDSDDDGDDSANGGWNFAKTSIGSFFAGLTGQKPLTKEDIAPAIEQLEKQLLSKNVSTDAAAEIVASVARDLEGQKLGSFTRGIAQAVRESCHTALQRLLTPKRSTDILREIKAARAAGRPYTIVFIGVNGVGKSTSLSKVCYYLKQNGLNVLLCACDTFRSGAVEQLKVHTRNLDVELFEQGYNKDASSVALNGVKYAGENGFDVVLIDTAGRMQNNEPLMRSLTKLIARNRPDLILFVGEALVGNDGRDQLVLFDKALADYSESADPRRIDGMILTKFDTIDDKVGAAVSMVHSTGQPIIFVGTGQKYTNLNRLNVSKVVKSLLS
eukprot:CAMPEP_0202119618 /NCGR_PEP_ID=MMETSP0965-20130614/43740_1 /ASSEMBLY_ACC=CAM_ASM_000507 /TAXON_ID=4773 /ORGANISM="Schizochytrium aggregatum, Strain ATCC28209" /LENGTH=561 /DNA_ID=CAMNT_0048689541 /DNA_START=108 /DNA_END=1794 /DNA_ORIENTATION=-